jgi:hypothetical protein
MAPVRLNGAVGHIIALHRVWFDKCRDASSAAAGIKAANDAPNDAQVIKNTQGES